MARKFVYFQGTVSKLGPEYLSCDEQQSSCTRRRAQPRLGCPDCEYTIQYKFFMASLEKELRNLKHGTWVGGKKWPKEMLMKLAVEIASLSMLHKAKTNPRWPVNTALLISIYRSEEAKKKSIDNYNLLLASDEGSNGPVSDIGDFG